MMPGRLVQLVFATAVLAALVIPGTASAAHPCDSIKVGGEDDTARVAVINVGCPVGREVAAVAYERIEGIVDAGGNATNFNLPGFRCSAVLAFTEMTCRRGKEWVLASTQRTDHPSEWQVVPRPWHGCIGVHTKKITGQEVEATAHFGCQGARKIMRRYFHLVVATGQTVGGCAQARGSKGCKVGRFRCYTRYKYATGELRGVCKGARGKVRFLEIDRGPR
jgi:hypothetical protein